MMDEEEGETMISDDDRREVAARLRNLADHIAADEELTLDALGLYRGENIEGYDTYGVMHLADLIDRPTCRMEECTIDNGSRSWGMRCTACGEKFEHMKPGFGWRFCPNCGAMVVEEGGCDVPEL